MWIRAPFPVMNRLSRFDFRHLRMFPRLCLLSAVYVGSSGAAAHADAQAQDILRKMSAVYDVNTFQGKVTLNQTGTTEENKPFNVSSVEEVTFKKPNLFYIKNSGPGAGGTQISAFNGKEEINYVSAQNRYSRLSSLDRPANVGGSLLALIGVRFDIQSGKIVNSTTTGGKAAYVVQVLPPVLPLPAKATAALKTQWEQLKKMLVPYELVIDKKDYHLLRVEQHTPAVKMSRTLDLTQQTLNPPIADNAFVFTPPTGAKLVTRQAPTIKDVKRLNVNGGPKSDGATMRVSRGSGSPVPAPHASPSANGTASRP